MDLYYIDRWVNEHIDAARDDEAVAIIVWLMAQWEKSLNSLAQARRLLWDAGRVNDWNELVDRFLEEE